jgi:hypothetical protein
MLNLGENLEEKDIWMAVNCLPSDSLLVCVCVCVCVCMLYGGETRQHFIKINIIYEGQRVRRPPNVIP